MPSPATEPGAINPRAEDEAERQIGTTRRTIARALRAGAITAVVQYLVTLAVFPVVVHHVGADLYGAWMAIASLLAIGALADAGLRTEITRRVGTALGQGDYAALKASLRTGVGILALAASLITVTGLLLAPMLRLFAFPGGVPGYTPGELDAILRATTLLLTLTLVIDGHLSVLRGVQRSDVETLSLLAAIAPGTAVTVSLAISGFGLWALFLGALTQSLTRWTIQWFALRRLMPGLGFGIAWPSSAAARGFLGFSAVVLLSQVSDVIDSQWDRVVLARFVGPTSVTFFSVGVMLILQAKAVVVLPLSPILAAVSELRVRDREALEHTYLLLSRVASVVASVLLAGLFILGPAFIRLWLGPDFSPAGTAIRLFTIAVALNLISAPAGLRSIAQGWHWTAAPSAIVNILVNGLLSFLLAATIGFNGPLLGSIAGNAAGLAVFYAPLMRRTRERWILPRLGAPLVGVAVAAITIIAHLDSPSTWLGFGATTMTLGVALTLGGALAERLSLRDLVASR